MEDEKRRKVVVFLNVLITLIAAYVLTFSGQQSIIHYQKEEYFLLGLSLGLAVWCLDVARRTISVIVQGGKNATDKEG